MAAAGDDDAVIELIQEEIEERWEQDWLCETDKAWDAIHRCLADGTLSFDNSTPLHRCILGGSQLFSGEDYIVSSIDCDDVRSTAAALNEVDEVLLRFKYDLIDTTDYGMPLSDEDFGSTWEEFCDLKELFNRAAAAGRAVVFTVDQ